MLPKNPRPPKPKPPAKPKPIEIPSGTEQAPRDLPLLLLLPPPRPASHARLGRTKTGASIGFHDPVYKKWREDALVAVRKQWPYHPVPAHTAIRLNVTFVSARTQSRPVWCDQETWDSGEAFLRPVRPDAENMLEAVQDSLMGSNGKSKAGPVFLCSAITDDAGVVVGGFEDLMAGLPGKTSSRLSTPGTIVTLTVLSTLRRPAGPLG